MADRTWVAITIHPDDLEHKSWLEYIKDNGEGDGGGDPNYWYDYECYYANWTELGHLAQEGVRFAGDHGAGDEYSPHVFFHDGDGLMNESPTGTWDNNRICVRVTNGEPYGIHGGDVDEQLALYSRYHKFWNELNKATKEKFNGT